MPCRIFYLNLKIGLTVILCCYWLLLPDYDFQIYNPCQGTTYKSADRVILEESWQ